MTKGELIFNQPTRPLSQTIDLVLQVSQVGVNPFLPPGTQDSRLATDQQDQADQQSQAGRQDQVDLQGLKDQPKSSKITGNLKNFVYLKHHAHR